MQYEYTQENRLTSPHNYSFSPYGNNFILSYVRDRSHFRSAFGEASQEEDLLNSLKQKTFKTSTAKRIQYLLCSDDPKTSEIQMMIKKFEVSKRLFTSYDENYKKTSEDFEDYSPYALLSLLLLRTYRQCGSLPTLNAALKINDTLCSIENLITDQLTRNIAALALSLELKLITDLYSSKSVSL